MDTHKVVHVHGKKPIKFLADVTVGRAEGRIRDRYRLVGGGIEDEGVAMDEDVVLGSALGAIKFTGWEGEDAEASEQGQKSARVVVQVPTDPHPFDVPLMDCPGLPLSTEICRNLLGMEPVVDESLRIINEELPKTVGAGQCRPPPLVFSRLARGGKTTVIDAVFHRLRRDSVNCIVITFSNGGFTHRSGESQESAILRLIASQLVSSIAIDRKINIECDKNALDRYIGEAPFVLLIDELNALSGGRPLDSDAGQLLRSMFLDKQNRYLVFSTHVPLDVDSDFSSFASSTSFSPRGCRIVSLPTIMDVEMLWKMSIHCDHNISPAEVALYGGVPSLIYSVKVLREMSPETRFNCDPLPRIDRTQILSELIAELIDGVYLTERSNLRSFDRFSSVPARGKIEWFLCYIKCILVRCCDISEIQQALLGCIKAIEALCQALESSKHWEQIVLFSLIVRCCHQRSFGGGSPFSIIPVGCKPLVHVRSIIAETASGAHGEVRQYCRNFQEPAVVVFVPQYSKFPVFDGFIAYHNPGQELCVIGVQMNLERACPKPRGDAFQWVSQGYLVRGFPADKHYTDGFWHFLNRNEIHELLGYSFRNLQPNYWPEVPEVDDFDNP